MPVLRSKRFEIIDGILFSSSGKHNCVGCEHNKDGFCKACGRFSYVVSDAQCERARSGTVVNFNYKEITKEFVYNLAKNSKYTFDEFCERLGLNYATVESLKSDKPFTTVQKKMYCGRLNKHF